MILFHFETWLCSSCSAFSVGKSMCSCVPVGCLPHTPSSPQTNSSFHLLLLYNLHLPTNVSSGRRVLALGASHFPGLPHWSPVLAPTSGSWGQSLSSEHISFGRAAPAFGPHRETALEIEHLSYQHPAPNSFIWRGSPVSFLPGFCITLLERDLWTEPLFCFSVQPYLHWTEQHTLDSAS